MTTLIRCMTVTGAHYVNFDLVVYVSPSLTQNGGSELFFTGRGGEHLTVSEAPEELVRLVGSSRRLFAEI